MTDKNIWYLPGPFHRYEDDVKAIAKKAGLRIIDANVTESRDGAAKEVPEVTLREFGEPVQVLIVDGGNSSINIEAFREELESVGVLVDLFTEQRLSRPVGELGETAERLYQVFEAINAGVESLRRERDGEVEKAGLLASENADLRSQLEALKAGGDAAGAKAAKAKPDAKP